MSLLSPARVGGDGYIVSVSGAARGRGGALWSHVTRTLVCFWGDTPGCAQFRGWIGQGMNQYNRVVTKEAGGRALPIYRRKALEKRARVEDSRVRVVLYYYFDWFFITSTLFFCSLCRSGSCWTIPTFFYRY